MTYFFNWLAPKFLTHCFSSHTGCLAVWDEMCWKFGCHWFWMMIFLVRMSYLSSRYALAAYWHPWPLNNFLHFQYPASAITCHVDIFIMLFSFRNQGRLVFICRKGLALSEFDLTCCFLVQPAASKMIVHGHWRGGPNKKAQIFMRCENVLSSNCNNLGVFRANSLPKSVPLVLFFFQNWVISFELSRKC